MGLFQYALFDGGVCIKNDEKLKPFIEFVQIKDGSFKNRETHEYFLPGKGEVPITKVLKQLDKIGYKGFISLEWEKRWHPELPDLKQALPLFSQIINA